jgi:ribose/xylose/arabinose/galactoside ABC-type transport system permease subunit
MMSGRFGPFIGLGTVLLLLVVYELATQPTFATAANLTSISRGGAATLILVAGMSLVLLTGGVDLSIGSSVALSGVFYAKLATGGVNPWLAVLLTLVFGGAVGFLINGVLIGYAKLSFFVVTLATLSTFRGIVYLWDSLTAIDMSSDKPTSTIGNEAVLSGHVPVGFLLAIALVVVLYLVLRYTVFGRSIYAVGGNEEAAELSGIRTPFVLAAVYGIMGFCAALAAIVTIGYTTTADPNMGAGIELPVISAALLGGLALSGGAGSIWGGVLGMVFLAVLNNALSLAGASESWQLVVTGVILVIAVYLDGLRRRAGRVAR